jgi:hypothetical protein
MPETTICFLLRYSYGPSREGVMRPLSGTNLEDREADLFVTLIDNWGAFFTLFGALVSQTQTGRRQKNRHIERAMAAVRPQRLVSAPSALR